MIRIRKANRSDMDVIVEIHNQAFPDFFLTSLGGNFLKLYYTSVLNHTDGIILVCENNKDLIGFCAGTLLSSGFNTRVVKANIWPYIRTSLKLVFTRPSSLVHLINNMSKEDTNKGDDGNYAELLSIGVDPSAQRCGAGTALLKALEEEVRKNHGLKLSLTTDFKDNDKAIGFYKSLGYEPWYEFVTYPNRRMYRLIKNL